VADHRDRIPSTGEDSSDVVGGRSRREPIVWLRFDVQRPGQLAARFAGAEQGAREDRLGWGQLVPHAPAEVPRLLPALRSQRPKLVRFSRRGLGVADEVEAHCG